ncbi:hypothetical protein [Nocardioides abyssi]|uniref:Small secreted hydrophilic protein n=1 Tax=Nocardioides abyssi TaxID=3058370 RepID=A0ABT8EUJ9_9ACTN|nr:hypothetical protein [Nocardioides abyssi]MDN4161847.1 hypothetical protein [Nocardioides abyssi]
MSPVWKSLLGLAVLLPVGGYVAGSLAAASGDDPAPREVIVIRDAPVQPRSPGTTLSPRPSPTSGPDRDRDGSGSDDDDDVKVVSPEPDDLDDEPDEDEPDEDERDDDRDDDRGDDD